ncbi:hypothetical protein KR009_001889 [Drosophila setifemur]|nr:hypothetical protein KR009_001889 [Drosophila setifemur]
MSGSDDDDWFNQDEDVLVQDLEQKVKQQTLEKNEEHIECRAPDGGSGTIAGRFSLAEYMNALKMSPIDMFLFFLSEHRSLFGSQIKANDGLKRISFHLEVLKSLCQLELNGFDEDFLAAFARETVLHDKIKLLIVTLLSKSSAGKCDVESEMMLTNMKWLLLRAHKLGVLGQQGYDLVELYKKLEPHLKFISMEELETFSDMSTRNVKGEIYPTLEGLLGKEGAKDSPESNANLTDISQYLNYHRGLMREEFLGPLREYVERLRTGGDLKVLEQQGLLWSDTFLSLNPNFAEAQRHSLIFLNLNRSSQEVNKERLKSIKLGALLCLTTSLDFENLILATVQYTEPSKLDEYCLSVEIVKQYNIGNIYDQSLIMFQTPVFFEPSRRVHDYLSTCSTEQFPMQRYIVDGEFKIQHPRYIKPGVKLTHNGKPFTPNDPPQELPFNESQNNAFKDALSREFCIIQGPPGTGKTHLSVELVNNLIQNAKALGTGPIIVLTYTNDSLDKFLIKMSRYTKEILRFGSQSSDPEIFKFNVRTKVNPDLVPPRLKRIWWLVNGEYKEKFLRLQTLYSNFDGSEENYQETLKAQYDLQQVSERMDTLRIVFQYFLARHKDLLFMTTSCAARLNFLFRLLQSKCMVFEEAGEIKEAHILACLTPYTEHVILVGDHKQLQPFTGINQVKPEISLFERLIVAGMPFTLLKLQYRMRPCIAELLVPTIYEELHNSDSVMAYEDVRLLEKNLFFVQHEQPEQQLPDMSFRNPYEAGILVNLAKFLIEKAKYKPSDIVILSPYNAQVDCIRKILHESKDLANPRVASVDSFQGLEANIVLLSLVRSNTSGQIGFLRKPNRVCVALSRARWGLYIIGNLEVMLKGNQQLWGPIANRLEEAKEIGDAFPIIRNN